ncbi:MAG: recombinase family protein [Deltaproteobacteria bacterium]|nr:recombinase family protein [Deltaproteobacteria bacterium]
MKTVALYARVSSERQAQKQTIASQLEALDNRATTDGHLVLPSDRYIDDGYSGATLIRPALERLRDSIAEGNVDILYVHSPDRLSRKYAYQVLLLEEFSQQGTDVVFLNGPSGQTAEDQLLVQVQGMIAEYERAKILERYRRGKLHKARTGVVNPLSGAPYGYLYVRKTETEPARYQIVLHEAKVVRKVFDWYIQEQVSIGEIVRRLAKEGIVTRTGKSKWDRSTIWAMLRNPAYKGQAAYGKTEATERGKLLRPIRNRNLTPRRAKSSFRDKHKQDWITIAVPPIVSSDVFDAAAEQLQRNRRLAQRNGRGNQYLLQGLVVCAKCGYAYYGKTVSRAMAERKKKERWAYYRCVGTDSYRFEGGRVCDNTQVRVDQLDGYVWESVKGLMQNPQRVMDEWSARASSDATLAHLRRERDESERFLRAQEKTLSRLRDAYEAGALDLQDLIQRSERVRTRIEKAKEELARADKALSDTVELSLVISRLSDFSKKVRTGLANLSWLQRRQLIRTLISRVEIDEEGATIVYRVPAGGDGSRHPRGSKAKAAGGSADPSYQLCGRRGVTSAIEYLSSLCVGSVV